MDFEGNSVGTMMVGKNISKQSVTSTQGGSIGTMTFSKQDLLLSPIIQFGNGSGTIN